ncbi:MAG TPA: hypothetical protein VFI31_10215 [Pirellulales bacterium]|nr:hypothetical protein [Pirellulales bacterium]
MTNRQTATVLALFVALHAAAAVLLAPRTVIDIETIAGCLALAATGAIVTPPVMLAFWAVFGPGRLAVRLPATLWLLSSLYLSLAYGEVRNLTRALPDCQILR